MKNDKKIERKAKELRLKVSAWCEVVSTIGNQNASTDRIMEGILDTAKKLSELYNGQFKYTSTDMIYKTEDKDTGITSIGNGYTLLDQANSVTGSSDIDDIAEAIRILKEHNVKVYKLGTPKQFITKLAEGYEF